MSPVLTKSAAPLPQVVLPCHVSAAPHNPRLFRAIVLNPDSPGFGHAFRLYCPAWGAGRTGQCLKPNGIHISTDSKSVARSALYGTLLWRYHCH